MQIGQRIAQRRHELKLSQQDLASTIGVTSQHISAIENNKRTVSVGLLVKMADQLGTTADYILTGKEGLADVAAAIRAEERLKLRVRRAFIVLLEELSMSNNKHGNSNNGKLSNRRQSL